MPFNVHGFEPVRRRTGCPSVLLLTSGSCLGTSDLGPRTVFSLLPLPMPDGKPRTLHRMTALQIRGPARSSDCLLRIAASPAQPARVLQVRAFFFGRGRPRSYRAGVLRLLVHYQVSLRIPGTASK